MTSGPSVSGGLGVDPQNQNRSLSALPDAVLQNPACGACGGETTFDGDDFTCGDCQLAFDADDLSAVFLDPEAEPCGAACDNGWHGDHKIRRGVGFDCGTCRLPAGHDSLHWTGCQMRAVERSAR